ncbi:protein kinase domain-containing protein [Actinacidiphila sp. ITFR-21]|uniref:protein kinase domain-containing protein n=1 Tax=Actinacidiphila sp. ITFR-21 TaxID=3075199 RepID=UPI00288AB573|nr:protein kinase [Streptomyces sp. ITFR-21]WNI18565.1 protein kinase [Streptomyces sp. ITFR-21]
MAVSHTGPLLPEPAFRPLSAEDPAAVAGHRISALLGDGALGRVYLAHAPGGRPVALTVARRDAAAPPGFAARFQLAAQAARRVPGGPHTAAVLGAGVDGDRCWLTTGYVPALSLRAAVAGAGPLPTRAVLQLVAGIAEGLRAVHAAGVVHGDLRPAQVLLTAAGPVLKGYGLASVVADPAAGGGPVFLGPEQAGGTAPSRATDVFALGQIAAYASIGAAPFGEGAAGAVLSRVRQEEPDLNELPGELREIVTRCLIKDPALRPSLAQVTAMCAQAAPAASRRFHRHPGPWLPAPLLAAMVPALPPSAAGALPPSAAGALPPSAAGALPPSAAGALPPATTAGALPPATTAGALPPATTAGALPPATTAGAMPPPQGPSRPGPPPAPPAPPAYRPEPPAGPGARRRTAVAGVLIALVLAVGAALAFTGALGTGGSGHHRGAGSAASTGPSVSPRPSAPAAPGAAGTSGAPAAPGAPSPPAASGAPAVPGGGGAAGPVAPPPRTDYQGFRLPAGDALSWRGGPPVVRPGPYSGDFGYTGRADAFATDAHRGTLALLAPRKPGTREECRAGTAGAAVIPRRLVTTGARVCVRSADGTTALLTIRQLTLPGAPLPSATVDVTIWRADESAESGQMGIDRPPPAPNSA